MNEQHLAIQVKVPIELLQRTLEKCKKFRKIKIDQEKKENIFVLSVTNWEKYQHIWMHQKAYRQRQKEKREKQKKLINPGTKKDNHEITGYDALGNRIGEDRKLEDRIENGKDKKGNQPENYPPPKREFLNLLKKFSSSHPYPFDEEMDGQIYDLFSQRHPSVARLTLLYIWQFWSKFDPEGCSI